MKAVVIDTNVGVVANGCSSHADQDCVLACIQAIREAHDAGLVLIDDASCFWSEYKKYFSFAGQPGIADRFFLWLTQNMANPDRCRQIHITPTSDSRVFAEFPDDPQLQSFDPADRMFVAVALASGLTPSILNAVDPGWWQHRAALGSQGVKIEFLCPQHMK